MILILGGEGTIFSSLLTRLWPNISPFRPTMPFLSYPGTHPLANSHRLVQQPDKLSHRAFAIGISQGMHAAHHIVLRHVNGNGLHTRFVVNGSLGKHGDEVALPHQFEQDIGVV